MVYRLNVALDRPGAKQALGAFKNERINFVKAITKVGHTNHRYIVVVSSFITTRNLSMQRCANHGLQKLEFDLGMRGRLRFSYGTTSKLSVLYVGIEH